MYNHNRDDLLKELGYDVTLKGASYFNDLIDDITVFLEVNEDDEEKAREFIPACILEYGHFCYECGVIRFKKDLNEFIESREVNKTNKEFIVDVFGNTRNNDLDDSVIKVSRYVNSHKENSICKPLKKVNK